MTQTKKLALSLSGGGARAMCYLGVMRALEDHGIKIDYISANSGAAIMLAYLAAGKTDEEVIDEFSKFSYWKFLSLNPFANNALFSIKRMIAYLDSITGGKDISELPYRTMFCISDMTDFDNPLQVSMKSGNAAKYAVISSLVPGLLPLYHEKGHIYADGSYSSLYSADELRAWGADVVIGLYPDALKKSGGFPYPIFGELIWVMKSLMSAREKYERKLEPIDLEIRGFHSRAGLDDFKRAKRMYHAGYNRGVEFIPQIRKLVA